MSPNIRGARRETCRRDTPFPTDRVQESIKTNRPSPRTWRLRLILVILDTNRKLTARYIYLNRKGGSNKVSVRHGSARTAAIGARDYAR